MQSERLVTPGDLVSITALVEWLAVKKGFQRENAYFLLEQTFNVPTIDRMKWADYDRAIALLVDLQNETIQ